MPGFLVRMRTFIIVGLCGWTLYRSLARVQGLAVCVLGFRLLIISLRVGDNLDPTEQNVDPSSPWHFALKKKARRIEGGYLNLKTENNINVWCKLVVKGNNKNQQVLDS